MTIKGKIYDKHVDSMKENGFDIDQSSNNVYLMNDSFTPITVDKDGNFNFNTELTNGKDYTKAHKSIFVKQ
jgi:hypothetical protein